MNNILIDEMKKLLANSFSLYLKAQNYHWNVTGPNFAQYHDFFGDLYQEIYESIDETAESIRKLRAFSPGSLSRFSELSQIEDELGVPTADIMIVRLKNDNDVLIKSLYTARAEADKSGEFGIVSYLESRLEAHEKHAWMLSSFQ